MNEQNIMIFKLVSGEEIIGYLDPQGLSPLEGPPYVSVDNPFTLVEEDTEHGTIIKLYNTLIFSSSERVYLNPTSVIASYPPAPEVTDYYLAVLEYSQKVIKPSMKAQITKATLLAKETLRSLDNNESNTLAGSFVQGLTGVKPTLH